MDFYFKLREVAINNINNLVGFLTHRYQAQRLLTLFLLFVLFSSIFALFILIIKVDGKLVYWSIFSLLFFIFLFLREVQSIVKLRKNRTKMTHHKNNIIDSLHLELHLDKTRRLFDFFIQHSVIDEDKTNFEDFDNVLNKSNEENDSIIYFKGTNGETKHIVDKFIELNSKLNLRKVTNSKRIYNKNGMLEGNALSQGSHKNPATKHFKNLINSIFSEIGR